MAATGLVLGGVSSGCGKTLVALGLMRACRNRGIDIAAAKAGPDYIDPGFHAAAVGSPSINLDPFAMDPGYLAALSGQHGSADSTLLVEGVMGVHDGGDASTASLAAHLALPLVLVMDIRGQSETAASVAGGIRTSLASIGVDLAGVVLNRSRSERHTNLVRNALEGGGIVVFGTIPENDGIAVPSRHLGLVQAGDLAGLERVLEDVAQLCEEGVDIPALLAAVKSVKPAMEDLEQQRGVIPPPAQRIAIAEDAAFGFGYEHLKRQWRSMGAELLPFSPLADEAPANDVGFVYLPGGYPELHLETLAGAERFRSGLVALADAGIHIYGECGGYMVLGQAITGEGGKRYPMAGLLGVETGFQEPKRHLGYRRLERVGPPPLPERILGHEFHYTTVLAEEGEALFKASDKEGNSLGSAGLYQGSVSGSYMHMIAAN